MPKILFGGDLVQHLTEMGWCKGDGNPFDYAELESWQRSTGHALSPWQARTILDMSRSYVSMRQEAKNRFSKPPLEIEDKAARNRRLDAAFL